MRQYSLCGDPAEPCHYTIAVKREPARQGGSELLHRIFAPGRKIFISRPQNNFPLVLRNADNQSTAPPSRRIPFSLLMGGGIGVTPLLAMAWQLYRDGHAFALHYSARDNESAAFAALLRAAPFRDSVHIHLSRPNGRADIAAILAAVHARPDTDCQVYCCGPERYIDALVAAAAHLGMPEDCVHREYFQAPPQPGYTNHPFRIRISGRASDIAVGADVSAAQALIDAGIPIPVKCTDGLCGVCRAHVVAGAVEHRDFVLAHQQRATTVILCQSRARDPDGVIEIALPS